MADRSKNRVRDEASARRAARAIVSDIRLYHEAKLVDGRIRAGDSFAAEIEEGRALFAARVVPELDGLFDKAVAELLPADALAAVPGDESLQVPTAPLGPPVRVPPVSGYGDTAQETFAAGNAGGADLDRARRRLRQVAVLAGLFAAAVLVWLVLR
jgi:hypothetical protein